MTYLITQMVLCLLLAFLLGLWLGWWLRRRRSRERIERLEEKWRGRLDRCRGELEEYRKSSGGDGAKLKAELDACREALAACRRDLEAETSDGAAEEGGTSGDGSAEEGGTSGDGSAEEGGTSDDASAEEGGTSDAAEEGGTSDDGSADSSAEEGGSSDDGSAEEGGTSDAAEEGGTSDAAEEGGTSDDGTSSALGLAAIPPRESDEAKDDLTRVEGIGPKIAGLLNADGIYTWAQLAGTDMTILQGILDKAGPRYRIHDPGTWPQQAGLAAAGEWEELDELQDNLKGGRTA